MADAARIAHVADVLLARDEPQVIVVSAMKGVTDALLHAASVASEGGDWQATVQQLEQKHLDAARELVADRAQHDALAAQLHGELATLRELLHAQSLVGAVSPDLQQLISGLGEILSSRLMTATLRERGVDCAWLDARRVLIVDHTELGAIVRWQESAERLREAMPQPPRRVVVPGFVARSGDGHVTTLGRNGSDYSGAIFAALFDAPELHVWSDVDGVLSADPRVVPDAVEIPRLSYDEACELAYFGAKVLHPQTMAPAIERGIAIVARNTFDPSHPGTRISGEFEPEPPVKGISTMRDLAILDLEGAGMIGVPGTAQRLFRALEQARVSVVMISQGSSEHSICCVIRAALAAVAEKAVRREFAQELQNGQIGDVTVVRDVAALAAVGDGMAGTPGIAQRMFSSLARANVNVRVIAQGSSERNISVVIDAAAAQRALRAVHAGFYLSARTVSIGVIGPGNVGRTFLRQLDAARERLLREHDLDLRVRAVAGSRRMALLDDALVGDHCELDRDTDLDAFTAHVHAEHLPHAVIVDCSASDAVADRYVDWLRRGVHVITPNKHAGAGPFARYTQLTSKAAKNLRARFCYEATVGAGLPILVTLRDLLDTGDRLLAVDGILSGTLAFLFSSFDGTRPFSALVQDAMQRGFTEPDPRDDLSGLDVARKLVILARENGARLELADVKLESLVPAALRDVDKAEFLRRLPELDATMAQRRAAADADGEVLRYVARLDCEGDAPRATVGLVAVPRDHALATIRPTDNVVQFTTERYRDNPLVVRGPGAGPEVTAMGIFADLLRVATTLGGGR
ncbi:MAG: bifunctional aspartate kinase/homoserine dehydrogenase I [Planctomycetes bacterium]|nr:bifunctional aspartate kinase/homoserine dehydrogenase I [Planctomycetota bacterium]